MTTNEKMFEFTLAPFLLFCLIATATPGPNNMINLAQGIRLGFWPAVPFAIGTGFGVGSLLFIVAIGLGEVATALPAFATLMRIATTVYLLYLAWAIGTSGPIGDGHQDSRIGFWGAIGFQWINPKAWASSLAMVTTYLPRNPAGSDALLAAVLFCGTAWLTQPIWIGFGSTLRRFLVAPRRAAIINFGLAVLLLGSTLPFLWGRG